MSAITLLRGITHVVIYTSPSKEKMEKSGVFLTANLCFGPGTENFIGNIDLIATEKGDKVWRLPSTTYTVDGKTTQTPVFAGLIAEEISKTAAKSLERVRSEQGKVSFNKVYVIPTGNLTKVQDVTPAKETA